MIGKREIYIGSAIAACMLLVSASRADEFAKGVRMGQLVQYGGDGIGSSEGSGTLMLGNESAPWTIETRDSKGNITRTVRNPWAFTSDNATLRQYQSMVGQYVTVEFRQHTPVSAFIVDSIRPVTQQSVSTCASSLKYPSQGYRIGRLVRVGLRGETVKKYIITMQIGDTGGNFLDLAATDPTIIACASLWLRSGRLLKVGLIDRQTPDTGFVITSLAPASGLSK